MKIEQLIKAKEFYGLYRHDLGAPRKFQNGGVFLDLETNEFIIRDYDELIRFHLSDPNYIVAGGDYIIALSEQDAIKGARKERKKCK